MIIGFYADGKFSTDIHSAPLDAEFVVKGKNTTVHGNVLTREQALFLSELRESKCDNTHRVRENWQLEAIHIASDACYGGSGWKHVVLGVQYMNWM